MQKKPILILALLLCSSLQGCLLNLFLAPKIAPEQLPGPPELKGLKQSYATQCSKCHLLINPAYFDAEHPIQRQTQRYLQQKIINEAEAKAITTYIQALSVK